MTMGYIFIFVLVLVWVIKWIKLPLVRENKYYIFIQFVVVFLFILLWIFRKYEPPQLIFWIILVLIANYCAEFIHYFVNKLIEIGSGNFDTECKEKHHQDFLFLADFGTAFILAYAGLYCILYITGNEGDFLWGYLLPFLGGVLFILFKKLFLLLIKNSRFSLNVVGFFILFFNVFYLIFGKNQMVDISEFKFIVKFIVILILLTSSVILVVYFISPYRV
jgi:hypothetical protein